MNDDKPLLLKAIEIILTEPAKIKKACHELLLKYEGRYFKTKSEEQIKDLVVEKIISNYSYYAALAGGTTALAGVVPGVGTLVAAFGGSSADAALSMKYQIEMTMAIATVFGHDIEKEEKKRLCFLVAGLGTLSEISKDVAKPDRKKAFVKMAQKYLKDASNQAVKQVFKKVGYVLTRKALEKAIPFGVGVVIGFSTNKGLTWYVGSKAKKFFSDKSQVA